MSLMEVLENDAGREQEEKEEWGGEVKQ